MALTEPDSATSAPLRAAPPGRGRRALRWARPLALPLVGGVAVALSIPPFGWWPLAWLGYAALAWSLWRTSPRRRFAAGAAFGVGQYLISIWWVTEFNGFGYGVLVIVVALFSAVAALLVPGRRFRGVALGLPAFLVLAEWTLDRFPLGGFPLGSAALGQTRGPLIPLARLGGSLGILAGTVTAGVIIAGLVIGVLRVGRRRPGRLTPLVAAAGATVVLVAAVLGGLWSPGGAPVGNPLRIALVQGGGPRGTRAVTTDPNVVFQRHLNASAGLQPPLDLVVWPEGILQTGDNFRTDPGATDLSHLAQRLHATVVAGVEEDIGAARYTNKVVAWRPDGTVADTYEKNHLVPFGEYVPWRSFLNHFVSLNLVPRDAIAGHGPGILSTPVGRLGVMISYEVFFDGRARGAVQAGGRLLLVPTNTASYSDSEVPTQELAAAQLRAWETGRVVLQVTPTGYSAVVGPGGQVRQRSVLGAQTNVEATVQPRQGNTVYVDVGDIPVALGGLILAAGAWMLAVRDPRGTVRTSRRRRRGSPGSPART